MKSFIEKTFKAVNEALFPPHLTCSLCEKEVFDKENFCPDCFKSLTFISGEVCDRCGRKTLKHVYACPSCRGTAVDLSRSVFVYSGGAETLIKLLKYGGRRYLAEVMAEYMAKIYVRDFFAPDIITFVPMTDKELFQRGFNHSRLLAEYLAKYTNNEAIGLLYKKFDTPNQAGLDFDERSKNLKGSFAAVDKKSIKGKKILVVDDVLTTGATSGEIASVLKSCGASSVYLLTFASVPSRKALAAGEESTGEDAE
ncbi:MAG: ComF family protein [Clostridia bacterium]|nr:ComF family protein [Clostridia bacterium]